MTDTTGPGSTEGLPPSYGGRAPAQPAAAPVPVDQRKKDSDGFMAALAILGFGGFVLGLIITLVSIQGDNPNPGWASIGGSITLLGTIAVLLWMHAGAVRR